MAAVEDMVMEDATLLLGYWARNPPVRDLVAIALGVPLNRDGAAQRQAPQIEEPPEYED